MSDARYQTLLEDIERLRDLELALSRLYAGFAAAFPEDAPLWRGLAYDEEGHALRVDELKALVVANRDAFHPDKFNSAALNTYMKGLEGNIQKLEEGRIGRRQALALALDFENTLVEAGFYRVVRSEIVQFERIAEIIEEETQRHRRTLIDYLNRVFPA